MSDVQAGHEKTMTSMLPAMAGANLLYGMGMLELGNNFSYAQLVIDNEIAGMVKRVIRGVDVNDTSLAVDVIREVGGGQGKTFLLEDHTMDYLRSEQQNAVVFDRQMRENWVNAGKRDAAVRAAEIAKEIYHTHKPTPLDAAVRNEFKRIIDFADK